MKIYNYYINIYQNGAILFESRAETKKDAFNELKAFKNQLNKMIYNSKYQAVKDIKINDEIELSIYRSSMNDDFESSNIYYRNIIIKNHNIYIR